VIVLDRCRTSPRATLRGGGGPMCDTGLLSHDVLESGGKI